LVEEIQRKGDPNSRFGEVVLDSVLAVLHTLCGRIAAIDVKTFMLHT
jgi:hypothetical protein